MNNDQNKWTAVDDYFAKLVSDDEAEAERASDAAGLPAISVSASQGKLLQLLVRTARAQRVLEVGTLGGHSAIWMARALRGAGPNSRLVTFELEPRHAEVARTNVDRAGVGDLVEIRVGPAAQNLQVLLDERPEPFDFVFIDADKASNDVYLDYAVRLGRPGTVIVVDNVVREGRVLTGDDEASAGVRRLVDLIETRSDVDAVAIQTVGTRGWDGFILAVVAEEEQLTGGADEGAGASG